MLWKFCLRFLYLFDAESIHLFSLKLLHFIGRAAILCPIARRRLKSRFAKSEIQAFGLDFSNSVGLAAGFDKNGEILEAVAFLGFGFVEVGTVTPLPQSGNPKPRLFRDLSSESLFNQMGFNNKGAKVVARHIKKSKRHLPDNFRIGINIGKNKITPLKDAASDYQKAIRPFENLVDYIVINVSSPNTEGLRDLQQKEKLIPIVEAVQQVIHQWKPAPALLVKFAPEMEGQNFQELLKTLEKMKIQGFVLTNTLMGEHKGQRGGWSGACLKSLSRRRLQGVRPQTQLPIISVGGIMTTEEAYDRLRMGANLIQIYSSFVFNGPCYPRKLVKALAKKG